uniref:NAD-dependent epimerase/dehydratase domain-containing protein n=1 Tax=Acrobeloides nanus TaxID=290746 RepID=A0A914E0B0_9BILA
MVAAKNNSIRVLVTGASGYVGSNCVQQLLAGGYNVRGTVRSLKNKEKVQPLRNLRYARERLELVEADLLESNSWPKAVDSCDYVLHVASPLQLVADANTIKTAVEGTLNVLKACSKCNTVKKIVLTSSVSSIIYGHEDNNHVFTEKDWSNVNGKNIDTYSKSKTLAEKAAWEFLDSIPGEDNKFKLTCLNPGLIIGPSLTDDQGTSVTLIKRILNHEMPGLPELYFNSVDVRDVAKAHILAMENPKTDGERIILAYDHGDWVADISGYLIKEFEPQDGHEHYNHVLTEKDWSNVNGKHMNNYLKSKTLAEKAAWDFVDSIPRGDNKFKLTCLNPGLIIGPSLTDDQGTSVTFIKRILNHEMPGLPKLYFNSVDVRDVAKAHILAMENPNTDGERIILVYDNGDWAADLAGYLAKEFGPQG